MGEDLNGIVFVRDYLQLQFNPPPQINVYSGHVVVSAHGRSAKFGDEAFANLAPGLIGKFVREVKIDEQSFRNLFADNSDFFAPRALPRSGSGGLSRPGPPMGCSLNSLGTMSHFTD